VLGHDLRNPLSSIVSGAALLELRPGDAEDTRRKARIILSASKRMERLIQQLLDFALARVKGTIPIAPAAIDLAKIARQVVAELGAAVALQVEIEVLGDPAGVWDSDRMMQVISNLVGNAVEHGERSTPILISIDGSTLGHVGLAVHNDGAIPRDMLPVLFSPFKPRGRQSRGLGLGLYIVDQIILAHGGRVSVRASEDGKTCFDVRLPRRSTAMASEPPSGAA
jgi:two-component system sensor histidine kinase/response regulator